MGGIFDFIGRGGRISPINNVSSLKVKCIFALLGGRIHIPRGGVESKMEVRLEGERGEAGPSASLPNADTTYL